MRPAIVLGTLALAFGAMIIFGNGPEGSFDDRFANAERELEAIAQSIDDDLAAPPSDKQTGE